VIVPIVLFPPATPPALQVTVVLVVPVTVAVIVSVAPRNTVPLAAETLTLTVGGEGGGDDADPRTPPPQPRLEIAARSAMPNLVGQPWISRLCVLAGTRSMQGVIAPAVPVRITLRLQCRVVLPRVAGKSKAAISLGLAGVYAAVSVNAQSECGGDEV
jgi:hypothetical protein